MHSLFLLNRLLEALYSAFDKIAVMRKVFKVETIGDCYVAACGLPTQRTDHAVVLVRFAKGKTKACHTKLRCGNKSLTELIMFDRYDLQNGRRSSPFGMCPWTRHEVRDIFLLVQSSVQSAVTHICFQQRPSPPGWYSQWSSHSRGTPRR